MGKRIPTNYFCWKKLEKMVQQELVEDIETVEYYTLKKVLPEMRKYDSRLKRQGLYLMVTVQGQTGRRWEADQASSEALSDMGSYESIIAVYPVRDGQVLEDDENGEIFCAADLFYRIEQKNGQWEADEDTECVKKIKNQMREILQELQNTNFHQEGRETRRIQLNSHITVFWGKD